MLLPVLALKALSHPTPTHSTSLSHESHLLLSFSSSTLRPEIRDVPLRPTATVALDLRGSSHMDHQPEPSVFLRRVRATEPWRSFDSLGGSPFVFKLVPAVGVIAFAAWGLGPLMHFVRVVFLHEKSNSNGYHAFAPRGTTIMSND
ncbi:hypothetical protein NL676_030584 [Syzygium grande]|nr:hypothetical protein NL676_030584 [Syzygium grande]